MSRPPQKIAVRVCNWIGDLVMNLPALDQLRAHFPDAEIVAIARPWVKDALAFRADLVDRCLDFDDKGELKSLSGFYRFCKGLREERFDLGLAFTKHFKGAAMLWLARVPVRAGFSVPESALFLNRRLPRRRLPKRHRHSAHDCLDLLETLGLELAARPRPRLDRDPALNRLVAEKFLGGLARPLLAIHAGAAYGTAKRWDPDRYAEVCRHFLERRGGSVILLGVAAEQEVNDAIAAMVNAPGLRNLCGQTCLKESIALISSADGFLSNDSGLMHVAAAFGTPQTAIFGPTDVTATYPDSPVARVLYRQVPCSPCFRRHCPIGHDCMKAIQPEEAVAAVDAMLAGDQGPSPE